MEIAPNVSIPILKYKKGIGPTICNYYCLRATVTGSVDRLLLHYHPTEIMYLFRQWITTPIHFKVTN